MTASARTDGATVKAVRHLFDDCFHVGTVEATSAGFRAFTARRLRLGSFDTEAEAEAAVQTARPGAGRMKADVLSFNSGRP